MIRQELKDIVAKYVALGKISFAPPLSDIEKKRVKRNATLARHLAKKRRHD